MKSLVIAAVAVAGVGLAAPAFAQTTTTTTTVATSDPTFSHPQPYVNLGYTYLNPYGHDAGELFGRGGLKFSRWFGAEAEVGGGVFGNHFATGPNANSRVTMSEGVQWGVYGVGFVPLPVLGGDKLELLGRVGYGNTPVTLKTDAGQISTIPTGTKTLASWNYGAGLQYALSAKNGVRFDYTRRDFQAPGADNPRDTDTYSVAFVHKF
jgi:hypothetical protein